jgi:ATP-dependent DNA helicase MPH1
MDVQISGSESSDEPLSDHSTHSDRIFAGEEFQPTQAPKGYNQRAAYMAGMSTQAAPQAGLAFKRVDKLAFLAKARKPVLLSEGEEEGSENEYELGSFVCNDEDVDFDCGFM